MKIKLQILTFLFISLFSLNTIAQTVGEYRSKKSGNWTDASTWEKKNSDNTWTASDFTSSNSANSHVTIRSGHTVTLDEMRYCTNLVIEAGATLLASTAKNVELRIGAGTSTYSTDVYIINNGTINAERMMIVPYTNLRKSLTISGSGETRIGALKPRGGNPNPIEILIDKDIDIIYAGGVTNFTLFDNANNKNTDDYTLTLNAGKTVRILANTTFHLHTDTPTPAEAGKYTYNINGTLDLSFSGITRSTNIFPFATAGSEVVLNVSGTIIFGKEFNTVNASSSPAGTLALNINGGIIDATATTSLTMGNSYFKLDETGRVKRLVNATDVEFPIGTSNSYNPAIINNTGTESAFTVGVKSGFDYPLSDPTKAVDKQWNITAESPGADATIKLGWLNENEGSSFNNTTDVAIVNYDGTQWAGTLAALSGDGTGSTPRLATINNVTSYGIFGVQNYSSLPLKLLSFEVKSNSVAGKNLADLKWTTTQEINTKEFLIERRTNEKNFEAIGAKTAINKSGVNYYSFSDENMATGNNYYRLKQVDINGDFTYSNVITLNNTLKNLISFYPNPVKDELTIKYGADKSATIHITSINGKKLHTQSITEGTTISLGHLKSGSYILSLENEDNAASVKFTKE